MGCQKEMITSLRDSHIISSGEQMKKLRQIFGWRVRDWCWTSGALCQRERKRFICDFWALKDLLVIEDTLQSNIKKEPLNVWRCSKVGRFGEGHCFWLIALWGCECKYPMVLGQVYLRHSQRLCAPVGSFGHHSRPLESVLMKQNQWKVASGTTFLRGWDGRSDNENPSYSLWTHSPN